MDTAIEGVGRTGGIVGIKPQHDGDARRHAFRTLVYGKTLVEILFEKSILGKQVLEGKRGLFRHGG